MTGDILPRPQKPSCCEKKKRLLQSSGGETCRGQVPKTINFEKLLSCANGNFEEQKRPRNHPKLLLIIAYLLLLVLLLLIHIIIIV